MKVLYRLLFIFLLAAMFQNCGIKKGLKDMPILSSYDTIRPIVNRVNDSLFTTTHGFISKNKQQNWELYVEGDPYQIGLNIGALSESLYQNQETIFFSKIEDFVPTGFKRNLLIKFLKYYNRDLYSYISNEYKAEIYGLSKYATNKFDFLGTPYHRNLYLHGAHDLGHAFQDLALVGCTSFAGWVNKTADGKLLIGRNFDFYVDDAFAEQKIIAFVKPDKGYAYMSVTWGGMIGVVSGMNERGLTITLNAGKSSIPLKAKTPISIVAREILQYASTIDEALEIAKKKDVFVSESLMIGSAIDKKAVVIEMTPKYLGVYDVENADEIICSNHFQSDELKGFKRNQEQIANSHSKYRWDRVNELLQNEEALTPEKMVGILRDKKGLGGKNIGYGNDKSLNHLLAHHSIVFQPENNLVWVSSNPYQLGEFVAYDLNEIFKNRTNNSYNLGIDSLTIAKDSFLNSAEYINYEEFRDEDRRIQKSIANKEKIDSAYIDNYIALNPNYWLGYYRAGTYFYKNKKYDLARTYFEKALSLEVTTKPQQEEIKKYLKKLKH